MASFRDQEFELHKHHRDVQIKHSYYLLAVSAAAIAFSIQKTDGLGFSCSQIPLGIAVCLWAFSFVSGCLFSRKYLDTYRVNAHLIELFEDDLDYEYSNEEKEEQNRVEKEMKNLAKKTYIYGEAQFYSLVLGGAFFVFWHLVEMAANT